MRLTGLLGWLPVPPALALAAGGAQPANHPLLMLPHASPAGHPGKSKRGELSIFPQRLQVGGSGCLCVTLGMLRAAGMLQHWL